MKALNFDHPERGLFGGSEDRESHVLFTEISFDRDREAKIFRNFARDYKEGVDLVVLAERYAIRLTQAIRLAGRCRRYDAQKKRKYMVASADQFENKLPDSYAAKAGPFGRLEVKCKVCNLYTAPSVHDVNELIKGKPIELVCNDCRLG